MYVKYSFEFWGSNGRDHQEAMEEFRSVDQAALCLGQLAYHTAIDNKIVIEKIIEGEEGDLEKIQSGIITYIENQVKVNRIKSLKYFIKENTRFLENVHNEIAERQRKLVEYTEELKQLESQP